MALSFHKSYIKLHSPHSKLHTFLKGSINIDRLNKYGVTSAVSFDPSGIGGVL